MHNVKSIFGAWKRENSLEICYLTCLQMVAFKKNWVTFKYLEYSDFHVGGKGVVLMLCLDRQDTPASPEGVPAVSGQRAWDLWAGSGQGGALEARLSSPAFPQTCPLCTKPSAMSDRPQLPVPRLEGNMLTFKSSLFCLYLPWPKIFLGKYEP